MATRTNEDILLRKEVVEMFINFNQDFSNKTVQLRLESYINFFKKQNIQSKILAGLIAKATLNCKFLPAISEILKPLVDQRDALESAENENKWLEFLKACSEIPYKKVPDWTLKMMRLIPRERVLYAAPKDIVWIKKGFFENLETFKLSQGLDDKSLPDGAGGILPEVLEIND